MNPWAFVAIAVGLLLIIIGVKGTQHNVTAAIVNHTTGGSGLTATPPGTLQTPPRAPGSRPGHPLTAP